MNENSDFEWDDDKDKVNQKKHGVSFALAQVAFLDHKRIILKDLELVQKKTGSTAWERFLEAFLP